MDMHSGLEALRLRLQELESENERLREELSFLKLHPTISRGLRGEALILRLVEGESTSYAASYDIRTADGLKIEVKYSKLNQPMKLAPTLRWNWSKPLGWLDKGKDYHFLLLIGEKDTRYLKQYLDNTPYVYFLVPIDEVSSVMNQGRSIGGTIQITTNLVKLQSKANRPTLLNFIKAYDDLKPLLTSAVVVA